MGCASSKSVGATAALDVYRPAPSSFAVFDINSIEEPWLKNESNDFKPAPSHVPAQILEKLNDASVGNNTPPRTWEEISNALEEVKNQPTDTNTTATTLQPKKKEETSDEKDDYQNYRRAPRKSASFHTLDELDTKLNPRTSSNNTITNKQQLRPPTSSSSTSHLRKSVSSSSLKSSKKTTTQDETSTTTAAPPVVFGADSGNGFRSLKNNPFILMDKTQKGTAGTTINWVVRRDPFADYSEICPPRGSQSVVLYTTSLRGVRKTFEDCSRARTVLEIQRVVFDERDVSLHAEFLSELRELLVDELDGGVSVPRIFIHGRYIGGADQLVELNETGRLGRMLASARVERGVGWQGCEGCGGARFVPCLECGGSCKVVVEGEKEKGRCPKCNENGLLHCPLCH